MAFCSEFIHIIFEMFFWGQQWSIMKSKSHLLVEHNNSSDCSGLKISVFDETVLLSSIFVLLLLPNLYAKVRFKSE